MIVFDAAYGENELTTRKDMMASAVEMLEVAGFKTSPVLIARIHIPAWAFMIWEPPAWEWIRKRRF